MKFILTGASGFIGGEILSQLLQKPSITSLIILSRRPLPELEARSSRIKVILLENFLSYPDSVVYELAGANACLWALGGSNSNPTPAGKNDEVEVQYPLTAARALLAAGKLNEQSGEGHRVGKIRFLFISGTLSERNQTKPLWFLEEGRRARGLAETKLLELASQNPDALDTVIIKAALVVGRKKPVPEIVLGASRNAIRVDELAAAIIDIARNGSATDTVGNMKLRQMGKKLLKK